MRDGTVIGEGVVLDMRVSSFVVRAMSTLIDVAVVVAVLIGVVVVADDSLAALLDSAYAVPFAVTLVALVTVGVPVIVETATRGRSLGKWLLGIRVVRDDAGPVRARHAATRALVGVGELWLTAGSVAIVASLSNDRGKRLGDILAGTYVVRVRSGARDHGPAPMPMLLAPWARTADVAQLPDDLALAARTFLGRAERLAPLSRARLADDLARRTLPFVAPGPPPGTPPEEFLAAVVATRRERELVASTRARELQQLRVDRVRRLPHEVPDVG
ncbi:RDD family protein [Paraoerskovia marina]|uniref:RDD family protein n=1 Tax=Paraoerskovia marina TaxID=545619 RepID=UPI0004928B61|nr:RDD family protein [Paraoerskovia marina]